MHTLASLENTGVLELQWEISFGQVKEKRDQHTKMLVMRVGATQRLHKGNLMNEPTPHYPRTSFPVCFMEQSKDILHLAKCHQSLLTKK